MKPISESVTMNNLSYGERKRIADLIDFEAMERELREEREEFERERDERTRNAKARCRERREWRMKGL